MAGKYAKRGSAFRLKLPQSIQWNEPGSDSDTIECAAAGRLVGWLAGWLVGWEVVINSS